MKNQQFPWKISKNFANVAKSSKFAKFQKFRLDTLVDVEKCCKTLIYLQRSVPIQPKTRFDFAEILPNIATILREQTRRYGELAAPSEGLYAESRQSNLRWGAYAGWHDQSVRFSKKKGAVNHWSDQFALRWWVEHGLKQDVCRLALRLNMCRAIDVLGHSQKSFHLEFPIPWRFFKKATTQCSIVHLAHVDEIMYVRTFQTRHSLTCSVLFVV